MAGAGAAATAAVAEEEAAEAEEEGEGAEGVEAEKGEAREGLPLHRPQAQPAEDTASCSCCCRWCSGLWWCRMVGGCRKVLSLVLLLLLREEGRDFQEL